MTDLDRQAAEFNRLVAKRKSMTTPVMTGPTNSASPKFVPGAAIAASKAALEARAGLAEANRNLAATKAKLAEAQAKLATAARVSLPAKAAPVGALRTAPPVAAKPAAATSKPAGLLTAAEFAVNPPHMTREEFRKLTAADRARFVREGGKIVD